MKLALGTAQFGLDYGVANRTGQVDGQAVREILALARASGIDVLDTAIAYGDSEAALGLAGVGGWRVVTKLPEMPTGEGPVEAWVRTQAEQSRTRLGIGQLDTVMLHRPGQLFGPSGAALLDGLRSLKSSGITKRIGVSIYAPDELPRLFDLEAFDVVQAPMSILDRRMVESGWADRLAGMGVELHARSVFLQGLLLLAPEARPAGFSRWNALWTLWSDWLNETGLTALEACLRYILSLDAVQRAVVGVDGPAQLGEIVAAAHGALPAPPDWPEIDAALINPSCWATL
ncbi:aldo/keto reductase [Sphingomonas sp. Root241]|uniref:aldo/keto reductase n=1 Tax=Sphingomonas sp. Root241 TaxID=1736501 RepID=UPI0006FCD5F9|nr:aldo/keto reductase [Sphingomonas sp. Root241]KRC81714.1 aldo/keto reductase [Sphingomonas sp. Root241]